MSADRADRPRPCRQLRHGYTNESWRQGHHVFKRYGGPDALSRMRVEVAAIQTVGSTVPVPAIVEVLEGDLTVVFATMPGRHGQDLLDGPDGRGVLERTGRILQRLHHSHPFLVHGDFGPQNLLHDPETLKVTAVLDWEFAHHGDPIEDLAWAEWIVRMHHSDVRVDLDALFDGYGRTPP